MINFTGVRLSKFSTELELPVDTTDLEDLKEAELVVTMNIDTRKCLRLF